MTSKEEADLTCRRLAAERHNVIARREALDAGHDAASIRRRVKSGEWRELSSRALYLGAVQDVGWLARLAGACVSINGAAFRRSAAALHRFPGFPRREIEVVTTGKVLPVPGASVHHTKYLPDEDITVVEGIPVTCPARTLLDICALLDERAARRLMLGLIAGDIVTATEIWDLLARTATRGRPGSASYRVLADSVSSEVQLPASGLEDQAFEVILEGGFPEPARQHLFTCKGVLLGRADLAYPPLGVGIEADGWDSHRSKTRFVEDRSRQNGLVSHGILILRFTARDAQRPLRFLTELERTLALARSLAAAGLCGPR